MKLGAALGLNQFAAANGLLDAAPAPASLTADNLLVTADAATTTADEN